MKMQVGSLFGSEAEVIARIARRSDAHLVDIEQVPDIHGKPVVLKLTWTEMGDRKTRYIDAEGKTFSEDKIKAITNKGAGDNNVAATG